MLDRPCLNRRIALKAIETLELVGEHAADRRRLNRRIALKAIETVNTSSVVSYPLIMSK